MISSAQNTQVKNIIKLNQKAKVRREQGLFSAAVCKFLGDISYPVYITHYPLVYIYTAWAFNRQATLAEGLPYMLLTFVGAFALAYACLKCYDLPVRKWLTERFLKKK